MRLALVTPYSFDTPGGVATHVRGLAHWLRGEGHEVRVIAPGTGASDEGEVLLGRSASFRFNGSVAQLAIRPAQSRRAIEAARWADVVHVHEPLTPGIAHAVAKAAPRLVVTHHASFSPGPLAPLLRLRARRLTPASRIAVSKAAADTAEAVTGHRPTVIHNAITMTPRPSARAGRPTVAFLGRLDDPRKGYSVFTRLAPLLPGVDLVAIGPGSGGAAGVRELGLLSDEERSAVLARADIVVAPNLYGESFGLVLIEALAQGASVVASDLPQFRAVIDDPSVISWFQPGDSEGAASAIRARLADPTDPVLAWDHARRYSWDEVGPRLLAAYRAAAVG